MLMLFILLIQQTRATVYDKTHYGSFIGIVKYYSFITLLVTIESIKYIRTKYSPSFRP